jgi:hypothetical protein
MKYPAFYGESRLLWRVLVLIVALADSLQGLLFGFWVKLLNFQRFV